MLGLKENVIIGKLIPAGTGMKRYKNIKLDYKENTEYMESFQPISEEDEFEAAQKEERPFFTEQDEKITEEITDLAGMSQAPEPEDSLEDDGFTVL